MNDNLRDRLMALADQWERQGSIVPAPGYPHRPAVKVAVERIRALLAAPSEPAEPLAAHVTTAEASGPSGAGDRAGTDRRPRLDPEIRLALPADSEAGSGFGQPWMDSQIAAAEQRGREDNDQHEMCYVHGSHALAARDAQVRADERQRVIGEVRDGLTAHWGIDATLTETWRILRDMQGETR
jgi:hypothetical protein